MENTFDAFNVRTVERLTGLTHRKLVHWDKTGLIKPSIRAARGPGSRRLYSFEDVIELRVVAKLRESGVTLQAVRKSVAYLHRHHEEIVRPLAMLTFITDGKRVFILADDPNRFMEVTAGGQLAFALDLAPIINDVTAKVRELRAPREIRVRVAGRTYRCVLTPDLTVGGFTIEMPELPGCFSEADTVREAYAMSREAIEGWLEADVRSRRREATA